MIIRVWRAKVHKGMEVDFWSFIQAQAVPLMQRQPGLTALHVGSILWGGGEFVIVSTWQDLNALQTFAGERWRDPFILPGEERFLIRAWVDHYHDQVDSDHRPLTCERQAPPQEARWATGVANPIVCTD